MKWTDDIRLHDGRLVRLRELHQQHTYEGLLEGTPHRAMNARIVGDLVKYQIENALGGAVHLIEPTETPIERHSFRGEEFASLPPIACVGRFESFQAARVEMCLSALVIIWFQDDFAPPIADAAMEQILKTPWRSLARDFDI